MRTTQHQTVINTLSKAHCLATTRHVLYYVISAFPSGVTSKQLATLLNMELDESAIRQGVRVLDVALGTCFDMLWVEHTRFHSESSYPCKTWGIRPAFNVRVFDTGLEGRTRAPARRMLSALGYTPTAEQMMEENPRQTKLDLAIAAHERAAAPVPRENAATVAASPEVTTLDPHYEHFTNKVAACLDRRARLKNEIAETEAELAELSIVAKHLNWAM